MNRTLLVMISDGLALPSGGFAESPYRLLVYCKVPEEWLEGDMPELNGLWLKGPTLNEDRLESLLETLYGKTWRSGNVDGSRYEVRGFATRLLNPEREQERPWQNDDPNNKEYRYFHYVADADGQFHRIAPEQL